MIIRNILCASHCLLKDVVECITSLTQRRQISFAIQTNNHHKNALSTSFIKALVGTTHSQRPEKHCTLPVSVAAAWTPQSWTPPQSAARRICALTWAGRCRSACRRTPGCPGSWRGPVGWEGTCSRHPALRWAAASWLLGAASGRLGQKHTNKSISSTCNVMKMPNLTLLSKELTFSIPYLHIAFPHHDLCCVGVLDQLLQSLRVDVMQGHMGLPTLRHLVCTATKNRSCCVISFLEPVKLWLVITASLLNHADTWQLSTQVYSAAAKCHIANVLYIYSIVLIVDVLEFITNSIFLQNLVIETDITVFSFN